jgi:hypothetical protein
LIEPAKDVDGNLYDLRYIPNLVQEFLKEAAWRSY